MTNCAIKTCGREAVSRGWCKPHYDRWRRSGAPEPLGSPGSRWYDTLPTCPACGATRSTRSLVVCSTCWQKASEEIRLEAYKTAKTDRSRIAIGDVALRLLASIHLARRAEQDTDEIEKVA